MGNGTVIRLTNGKWTEVFVGGSEALKGWRAHDGTIWIQKRGPCHPVGSSSRNADTTQSRRALADGRSHRCRDNNFWVGTAEGVARYSPPLWRTPAGAAWADGPVKSVVEDVGGRTWFLTGKFLVLNDHDRWRRFPLPPGQKDTLLIDHILIVDNGELVMRAGSRADIVIFSPVTEKFRFVRHPQGKRTGVLGRRRSGGIWVQVFESDGIHWHLESFDGVRFPGGGPDYVFEQSDLRVILEARNGDIWTGSAGALGLLRGGRYRQLGSKDGLTDTGVFAAIETAAGHILLGGHESVTDYDGRKFRIVHNVDLAESICLAPNGVLWVASGSGVHRFRPGQWISNTAEDGLPSASVHEVYCDPSGRVWIGTTLGIGLFYPNADPDPPITKILDDQNLRETPPGGEVRMVFSGVDKWKFTSADRLAILLEDGRFGVERFRAFAFCLFQTAALRTAPIRSESNRPQRQRRDPAGDLSIFGASPLVSANVFPDSGSLFSFHHRVPVAHGMAAPKEIEVSKPA